MPKMFHPKRIRSSYMIAAIAVIVLGLASRKFPGLFPHVLGKYPGDALWALLVFLLLGIAKPSGSIPMLAIMALSISFINELSQIYQAPWIDAIRGTALGHIVLGSSFSWLDLIAYTVGIALGIVIEMALLKTMSIARCPSAAPPDRYSSSSTGDLHKNDPHRS
jgi:hypothetical protein